MVMEVKQFLRMVNKQHKMKVGFMFKEVQDNPDFDSSAAREKDAGKFNGVVWVDCDRIEENLCGVFPAYTFKNNGKVVFELYQACSGVSQRPKEDTSVNWDWTMEFSHTKVHVWFTDKV